MKKFIKLLPGLGMLGLTTAFLSTLVIPIIVFGYVTGLVLTINAIIDIKNDE